MRNLKYAAKWALWRASPSRFAARRWNEARRRYSIAIYTGPSPFELRPAARARNPVLTSAHVTDAPVRSAADPFICRVDGRWYLYFEVINQLSWKGEIAFASSDNGFDWDYHSLVLQEPFHLSYPQVFQWRGDVYMIPETGRARSVRLYQAAQFPTRWVHVATLLDGCRFVDSSVFFHDGRWWMFTDAGPSPSQPVLRLFHAPELRGPWREHPASPIVENDARIARPAGRVIIHDGMPVRFTQPVLPAYGTEVRAFAVTDLTRASYRERAISDRPLLGPGNTEWNAGGMHHVDPHRLDDGSWLACVDGCHAFDAASSADEP
jgi:hypothetical protein